ncbi:MAG: cobalt ECF transporter T component CbiQ [Thermoanaerobacteraceae bacterium]
MDNFLEKTLLSIQDLFGSMLYSDEISSRKGILQQLEPRTKVISILLLIIIINFSSSLIFMTLLLLYTLFLAFLSKIPYKQYIFRVSAVSILFSGLILIPSLFNIIRNGHPLIYITDNFYITKEGAISAITFMMRSFISLSLVYLLTLSTKWADLIKVLSLLKLPRIFAVTIDMSLRYVFLLLEIASNTFMARKSRNLGKISNSDGRKFVSSSIANIFIRSQNLNDEVYSAMLSRGYNGEYRTINNFKISFFDYIWVFVNILIIISLFYINSKGGTY